MAIFFQVTLWSDDASRDVTFRRRRRRQRSRLQRDEPPGVQPPVASSRHAAGRAGVTLRAPRPQRRRLRVVPRHHGQEHLSVGR